MNKFKINFINLFAAIIILTELLAYYYKIIDSFIMIALISSSITIYLGSLKLKIESDMLFKELFLYFNDKYNAELNDLINELKYNVNKKINQTEKALIIDYFNLCAEEYLWFKKSRIPSDVWNAWRSGIIENINIKQINKIYFDEISSKNNVKSYYGLVGNIKNDIIIFKADTIPESVYVKNIEI